MDTNASPQRPRIAASSYLNTAPLIWSFIYGSQRGAVDLLTDTAPARCAEMLARGEVDAALVPVIEYQRHPDLLIVPNVCVGSLGAVRSVVLVSRLNNLKKIKRVALDDSSRTSVALVKIIFREFLGFEPEWETSSPDLHAMLRTAEAALIIGDPAMKIPRDKFRVFDLATLWHEFTGFGFVFAMWMARKDSAERIHAVDFVAARDEGLAHVDEIASETASPLGLSPQEIKTYLTENIAFSLGEQMRQGLERYFELAVKHRLIEAGMPLRFIWSL
ncbi:MAG TPA: menaquinone biosynthesis protein [Pyrinomonadaceae bacterium]|nr:menaquinone biosynthesis protein [Pyrinomonadaceae bacterium]